MIRLLSLTLSLSLNQCVCQHTLYPTLKCSTQHPQSCTKAISLSNCPSKRSTFSASQKRFKTIKSFRDNYRPSLKLITVRKVLKLSENMLKITEAISCLEGQLNLGSRVDFNEKKLETAFQNFVNKGKSFLTGLKSRGCVI